MVEINVIYYKIKQRRKFQMIYVKIYYQEVRSCKEINLTFPEIS